MSDTAALPFDLEERRRLLDEWVAVRTEIARLEARASHLLTARTALHDADVGASPFQRDAIYRSMTAEYAAAGHVPKGTMDFAFADAHAIDTDFPAVRASFDAGTISAAHVREICRAGALVSEAVRNRAVDAEALSLFANAVLVVAETDTAARTRAHARQVAAALVGETVQGRHERAAEERCVTVRSLDDGLALLTAVLPEYLAVAIRDRLTQMSRHVVRTRDDREPVLSPDSLDSGPDPIFPSDIVPGGPHDLFSDEAMFGDAIFGDSDTFTTDPMQGYVDPLEDPLGSPDVEHIPADRRTLDQIRADLLVDLLLGADPSDVQGSGLDGIHARIQVTVAATTLAGLDDRLAEFDGHGPLHPDIARALAGRNAGWSRLFLDANGMVTETDTYTPTESMRRYLRARDQHCRFPGCRVPVHRCDIDHHHDHARGGRTRIDNLGHFCRGDHTLKHPDVGDLHRWTARARPGGAIEWTSPLGNSYQDRPSRRVMFV